MCIRKWLVMFGIALLIIPVSIHAKEKKATPESLPGVNVIEADKVKEWLDAGEDIFILDARKAPDYESGHIPGAERCTVPSDLNVEEEAIKQSVAALQEYEVLKELNKDTRIITYCNGYT